MILRGKIKPTNNKQRQFIFTLRMTMITRTFSLLLTTIFCATASKEIIQNGGFEDGTSGWGSMGETSDFLKRSFWLRQEPKKSRCGVCVCVCVCVYVCVCVCVCVCV